MVGSSQLKVLNPPHWVNVLRKNFNRVDQLADFLGLNETQRSLLNLKPKFPIQVPLRLAEKMEKGNLCDPLTIQFLPLKQELDVNVAFVSDPVCDTAFRKKNKLLHKYFGRVLLVTTGACAMHCRFCFRQNFDYEKNKDFEKEIRFIAKDSTIHEVILSGGDPLSLSHETLRDLLVKIAKISHVKKIRFHTRFPIGIPERIDEDFLVLIASLPKQIVFVLHCNHPKELDDEIFARFKSLQKLGCIILNQAVLLKGVNDQVEILHDLCEQLSDNGIIPYYLHQLDRVAGAAHFEVSEEKGHLLIRELRKRLPGYAVPKYVREVAGELSKVSLIT